MKSHAQLMGHPLHPILIAFPIAFLYGAPVADIVGRCGGWPSAWMTGAYLSVAAVVTGLVAAVPGFIDFLYTVPPRSSAKARTVWHLGVNVTALVACAAGWFFREQSNLEPGVGTILLEVAAAAFVTAGGYLGGTLVYRNQIGVDHRYAQAGKWREQEVTARPGESAVVARADELKVGHMKLLRLGDRRVVLARAEDGYVAFDDHCTHRGGSLAGGVMACGVVTCPWHGSQFDVCSGAVRSGPAQQPVGTYRVEQAGDEVRLVVPGA